MATIGQALTAPDVGWKRYDDRDVNIQYVALNTQQTVTGSFQNTLTTMNTSQVGVVFYRFNFTGDKIRIMARLNSGYSSDLSVKIDGTVVGNYSTLGSNTYQSLVFEKTGLQDKEHYVEVINNGNQTTNLDAIDIDVLGEIKPYNEDTTVNKTLISLSDGYKRLDEGEVVVSNINAIPKMTSYTAPNGIASASSEYSSSYPAWKAFDADDNASANAWITSLTEPLGWLAYEFDSHKCITSYSIRPRNNSTGVEISPSSWFFEALSDLGWIELHAVTNKTDFKLGEFSTFNFTNDTSYKKYRIRITSRVNNNATQKYCAIGELRMFESLPATLPSWETVSQTLPSLPQFQEEGMEDLSIFDRKVQQVLGSPQQMNNEALGEGKVFKGTVDLRKYFDLRKLEVK